MRADLLQKSVRYLRCYRELALGARPNTVEGIVDYCTDRPILIAQVRSEIIQLGKLLESTKPKSSLEIGTNYGGTLFLLCAISPPGAKIISVDLKSGPFGGGYPRGKIPLFRRFPRAGQKLHLIQADSHSEKTKERVLHVLGGERLDYLFLDGDHTYSGVQRDFQMYGSLVRSGGMIAFHDIVTYNEDTKCEVATFWNEIKPKYQHQEIIEHHSTGSAPVAVTGATMDTAGLGLLFMP